MTQPAVRSVRLCTVGFLLGLAGALLCHTAPAAAIDTTSPFPGEQGLRVEGMAIAALTQTKQSDRPIH
ncbi:MAG: hypothetical protein AAGF75_02125 [Cyanobacteria bacterium P01_H01_bin.130]